MKTLEGNRNGCSQLRIRHPECYEEENFVVIKLRLTGVRSNLFDIVIFRCW